MPFTWSDMEFLEGAAGYFMLVNLASVLLFISKLGLSFFFFLVCTFFSVLASGLHLLHRHHLDVFFLMCL